MYLFQKNLLYTLTAMLTQALALVLSPALAQLNPDKLSQYSEINGLPASTVYSVLPDKAGYIWIGTINGLTRFDGYEFKRFYPDPNDSASIRGTIYYSLFEDRKGNIWVGGVSSINVYNPVAKSFRHFDFYHLLDNGEKTEAGVSVINEDAAGRIYLGVLLNRGDSISHALLFYDEKADALKRFEYPDSLSIGDVFDACGDKYGNYWVASTTGIFKIDTAHNLSKIHVFDEVLSRNFIHSLKDWGNSSFNRNKNFASEIECDPEGKIWIGTAASGLYKFDPESGALKSYAMNSLFGIPDPGIMTFNITLGQDDNLWLGTNRGLICFNKKTEKFEIFKEETINQVEQSLVWNVAFDSFSSLWMGTETSGLLRYDEQAILKSYSFKKDDKASLSPGWAYNISETHDGKVWILTGGQNAIGGFNEYDPATGKFKRFLDQLNLPGLTGVNCIKEITPDEFYISTNLGTFQYNPSANKLRKLTFQGIPDILAIHQFHTDSEGNFWLCTLNGLYRKRKGTEVFTKYDLSLVKGGTAGANEIMGLIESKRNGLWLKTNEGLYLYDYKKNAVERHAYDRKKGDVLFAQDINSIYEDNDGILWVGTWLGGLGRYNVETGEIENFTTENGLPSMSIQGILGDEKNNALWLSTFDGLVRFDLRNFQCNNFSISDGIQSQLFADGSCLKTSKGLFLFGGSNGVTIINPDEISKNSTPPKVFLTDLKLFNKSITPGENSVLKKPIYETTEIILAHNQNNISIDFIAIHYANPLKNRYAYKLENYENDWREVGNQRTAFYPKLPPGEYLFRVKAANNNGVWNEEGASLKIIVNPPWWRTSWALGVYLLLLIGLVFAADRYFRSRLIQKERDRAKQKELEQAREIEQAYTELKSTQTQLIQSEKMASLGELTAGIAHEIQNPLNFVNNFSEVNKELIGEIKQEIENGNLAVIKSIADDIGDNEDKILYHGKRADAIVKSMLLHSGSRSGQIEPTDINALADEYLRLAYHGLRAKDKSFNASLITSFDDSIGKINVVPEDIGRVLLNLFNNAFYAVSAKASATAKTLADKETKAEYQPTVSVSTKRSGDKIEISVKDNGLGIPDKIKEKIFQPFFTTKPTGQGTGLGLSLSYDIVTAHRGELVVESKEGDGSTFLINFPVE